MANPAKKSTWQNWNEGQDNWADWEPQIRNTWGNLTDEEIEMIESNPDALYSSVSKRYNWTNDQVDNKMTEIATNITRATGGQLKDTVGFGKKNSADWSNQKQAGHGENNWASGKGAGNQKR